MQIEVSYIEEAIEDIEVPKNLEESVRHLTHAYALLLGAEFSERCKKAKKYLENTSKTAGDATEEVLEFVDSLDLGICEDSSIYISCDDDMVYSDY